jgi:hypothetical protein
MNEFDDELYDDEEEPTILLAELEWKPFPESIVYTDPDFSKNIVERIKGVSEAGFAKEVDNWQEAIQSLPNYDEIDIRKEIAQWNIGIPRKDDFDFDSYTMFYSLQVQYRNRLTEIINVVFAHHEMLSQAQKTLKDMAIRLANGTAVDKNGIASFTVQPFSIATTHAKRLHTYLESVLKNIDFAASQMDRMLREHQALARINSNFNSEGMSSFLKDRTPRISNINNSTEIRTRNKRS